MSSRNGDKSRFNRLRKAKLRMRELSRELRKAGQREPEVAKTKKKVTQKEATKKKATKKKATKKTTTQKKKTTKSKDE